MARRSATPRRPRVEELEHRELLTTLMMVNSPRVTLVDGAGAPSPANFTVSLNTTSAVPVTVQYQTINLTSRAGTDFLPAQGSLTFNPGVTEQIVSVPVLGQTSQQLTKAFGLKLTDASNAMIIASVGVCSIVDTTRTSTLFPVTAPPTTLMMVNSPRVSIIDGAAGPSLATFTISLNAPSTVPVSVQYQTGNMTAQVGNDFLPAQGSLTFNPGVTTQTVSVPVLGQTSPQLTKAFSLRLTNAANAIIISPQGVCSIVDVTPAMPLLSIDDPRIVQGSSGTQTMVFTASLNEPVLNKAVTVNLSTRDSTALAGVNYQAKSQLLTFAPGQTSQQFSVTIFTAPRVPGPLGFFVAMTDTNVDFKKANGVGLILPGA